MVNLRCAPKTKLPVKLINKIKHYNDVIYIVFIIIN